MTFARTFPQVSVLGVFALPKTRPCCEKMDTLSPEKLLGTIAWYNSSDTGTVFRPKSKRNLNFIFF